MKKLLMPAIVITIFVLLIAGILIYPKYSNMKAEYETARIIQSIENYIIESKGNWPVFKEQLNEDYSQGVIVDYSITTDDIIKNPDLLKSAIRPKSGEFLTYPHYLKDLDRLLKTIKEFKEK